MKTIAVFALTLLPLSAFAQLTGENKKSADGLEYVLKKPRNTQKAPIMVLLHGSGADLNVFAENPGADWASAAEKNGYILVVPKGTAGDDWADGDKDKVLGLIQEIIKTYGADPKRVFIGGFSSGAFRAVEWGLTNPDVFAAVLAICGGSRIESDQIPDEAKEMGIYIIAAKNDRYVKFDGIKTFADKLKEKGFKNLVFKEKNEDHVRYHEEAAPFFKWVAAFKKKFVAGSNKSLPWESDVAAAVKKAEEEKKKLMIYFYGDKDSASPVAENFETELFKDKDVIEALKDFVLVKVNRDKEKDLAREFKVTKPSIVFAGPDKKRLESQADKSTPKQFVEKIKKAARK